jgi:hypothetical protein
VLAEVEDLLQRAGEERRHVQRRERRLAGRGQRGGLARRVVADERQRAAVRVGAREVGVAQRVHRAVQARVLAVPDPGDAVEARPGQRLGQLGAVDGGRRELLVEAGGEVQLVVGGDVAQPEDLLVQAAQRRALVAGDEGRRAQAAAAVGAHLVEEDADQRLGARQEDRALLEQVLVAQLHVRTMQLDRRRRRGLRARCTRLGGRRLLLGDPIRRALHSGSLSSVGHVSDPKWVR